MDLDLGGIFLENSTYSYDGDYVYKEECSPEDGVGVRFGTVFLPMLYSLTLVLGLVGNVLVLVVLVQRRRSWSVMDTFILHLGLADTLLLVTLPLWAVQATGEWSFGTPLCKITGAMFTINFYCSIFLLACISLEALDGASLSVHFLESVRDTSQDKQKCVHNYPSLSQSGFDWRLASRLLYHTVGFLLPSAVLLFCYSCILLQRGSQGLQKQRAGRVILALVLVFFLCWTPYNITLMVDTFQGRPGEPVSGSCENGRTAVENSLVVTFALACLHACLNPVLHLRLCRNFRRLDMVKCVEGVQNDPKLSLWDSGVFEDSPDQAEEKGTLNPMTTMGQVQSTQS
uniref:C-X-C chemokine receptor type 3-like n=1 Tax=Oncorhynchus gorbuscha TaxID=8017 RepID=UPI001EAF37C8|nr:C-X-C chemokine receptor type 3-like [Oncorhynchus gorbuscha]